MSDTQRPAGSHLHITWECITNNHEGENFLAALTLTNRSAHALQGQNWAIYFNTCRKTVAGSVTGGVDVIQVNGDLTKLVPLADFGVLAPGQSRRIEYKGQWWVVQETDGPLGFYIVYGEGTPAARAEAIGNPTIVPFTRPGQRSRAAKDQLPAVTPESRFAQHADLKLLPRDEISRITPKPLSASYGEGEWLLSTSTLIAHSDDLASEARYLSSVLGDVLGRAPAQAAALKGKERGITLAVGDVKGLKKAGPTGSPSEAYRLTVSAKGIQITGASPAGVFNGIQSLRQLLPLACYVNPQPEIAVPFADVIDAPRFAYRGMHIDVGRNFSSKRTVLRLLDLMALYKVNKFHFHLTDDEGWRVEIASLPELTEIGSRRGFTTTETDQLVPSFGSGAEVDLSAGTGFYSRADFIEILRFAQQRHIEVIPEFDVPGHARAAIKAMNLRYQRLMAAGKKTEAHKYLLCDFDDQSTYESVQLWHDNVICVALEGAYNFIDTVIGDVKALYREAGVEWKVMHTGGDEIPAGAWEKSPKVRAFMKAKGLKTIPDLQDHFFTRYRDILHKHDLRFAGWEETAMTRETRDGTVHHFPNPRFLGSNFQVYVWNNVWGANQEDYAYQLANAGYETVLCNVTNLYFDLAYEKDPQEPGYYWGGFIDVRKAFEFIPLDIFSTAKLDLFGNPMDPAYLAGKQRLTAKGAPNIIGLQAEVWGENCVSSTRVEHLVAPRMLAFAERAWVPDPGWATAKPAARQAAMQTAWQEFANRLGQQELPRLDWINGGYGYRVPVPGAQLRKGKLHANIDAPGITLRYSTNGQVPTSDSPRYTRPVAVKGQVQVAAFTSSGRRGRVVDVSED